MINRQQPMKFDEEFTPHRYQAIVQIVTILQLLLLTTYNYNLPLSLTSSTSDSDGLQPQKSRSFEKYETSDANKDDVISSDSSISIRLLQIILEKLFHYSF